MATIIYGEALATPRVRLTRKERFKPLTDEQKESFINYFMGKYPLTTRIVIKKSRKGYFYVARAYYKTEKKRTFDIWAVNYEMLIIKMDKSYASRGIPPVHFR